MSGRPSNSTSGQRSTRPGDLCSVLCSSIMCLWCLRSNPLEYATRRRSECPRIVWQPASHFLQGSSIVPERERFAQGPPFCCSKSPTTPKCAVPREMAFRYVELWPPHTPRQRFAEKSNGQMGRAHTRHVASDFMPPTSHGTMGIRGTEGLPSRDVQMPSTARRAVGDVLWLHSLPSVPLLTAPPARSGPQRLERILKSRTMGKGWQTWTFLAVS